MIIEHSFSIISLKSLLDNFYIDAISKEFRIDINNIEYVNSDKILINGNELTDISSTTGKTKKAILKDAESRLQGFLETFQCSRNEDVTNFLHNISIDFQKRNRSRTYLIIDDVVKKIVGYFALSLKPVIANYCNYHLNINFYLKHYTNPSQMREDCPLQGFLPIWW